MRERILQSRTRELGAIYSMCWNPTRQVYVALFPLLTPPLSSSLSICLHPLSQASCLSLHLFFVLFPGYHVGTVWDVFVCLLRQSLSQTEKLETCTHTHAHANSLIHVSVCTNTKKHTFGHTHTCTDESVLVLKTPRDSERGLILKCQVWNRIENKVGERRLLVALHVMCTLTHETALCWEYVLHIQATMYIWRVQMLKMFMPLPCAQLQYGQVWSCSLSSSSAVLLRILTTRSVLPGWRP